MTEENNTNTFDNKTIITGIAVIGILAGFTSMMFIDTSPATPDLTNDIEIIEVVAEPDIIENPDDEGVEPAFDKVNNTMTENQE